MLLYINRHLSYGLIEDSVIPFLTNCLKDSKCQLAYLVRLSLIMGGA